MLKAARTYRVIALTKVQAAPVTGANAFSKARQQQRR